MKIATLLTPILLSTFIISCGENTTLSPIPDIKAIKINETNISMYSTDVLQSVTANAIYTNNTEEAITTKVYWKSEDYSKLNISLSSKEYFITPLKNGADLSLSVEYKTTFKDKQAVHIKELVSLNYSDLNISDLGTPQTIYITGNFENNETNVTLFGNLYWTVDSNATISEVNASQITLTVDYNTTSILLKGRLFPETANEVDFNRTFLK